MSVASVENNKPPIMVTAIEPNKSSDRRGIIPSMVVSDAIITALNREQELSISAVVNSNYISSLF